MTTKKPAAIPSRIANVTKTLNEDTIVRLTMEYHYTTFRFMFDGGDTVDVLAIDDNSDLRKVILDTMRRPGSVNRYDGIVGVAIVEEGA